MSGRRVDRLPIIISQPTGDQLLDVAKLHDQTGADVAEAVYKALIDWNATDGVVAMSFDTEAKNTGPFSGACTRLERKLGRSLLKLACRHHVYEIMSKTACEQCMPATRGPEDVLCNRFRQNWPQIDHQNYEPGVADLFIAGRVNDVKDEIIQFCQNQLKNDFARADYKELLELTVIFLGGNLDGFKFRKPGSTSNVRWMSRALYFLKMQMFMKEFSVYSRTEIAAIRDISIFIVRLYTKAFIGAWNPLGAPKQDLEFLKAIKSYRSIDLRISNAVLRKFCTHAWYLHPETVALAFFDDNVSEAEKILMAEKLQRFTIVSFEEGEEPPFRYFINPDEVSQTWQLDRFVDKFTIRFFERYDIDTSFILKHPSEWESDQHYTRAKVMLKKLLVVNDIAERGVKLAAEFNNKLVLNEKLHQYLLLVVAHDRKTRGPLTKAGMKRKRQNSF